MTIVSKALAVSTLTLGIGWAAHNACPGEPPNTLPNGPKQRGVLNHVATAALPGRNPAPTYGDVWAEGNLAALGNNGLDIGLSPPTRTGGVDLFDVSSPSPLWLKLWSPFTDCNAQCQNLDIPGFATMAQQSNFPDVVIKNKIGYFSSDGGLGIYIVDLRTLTPTAKATPVLYHITESRPLMPGTVKDRFESMGVHDIRVETLNGRTYLFAVGIKDPWDDYPAPHYGLKDIRIYDVTDVPSGSAPVAVADIQAKAWVHDVTIRTHTVGGSVRHFLYASITNQNGLDGSLAPGYLEIYDITNPSAPWRVKSQAVPSSAHSAYPTEDGKYVYLTHEHLPGGRSDNPYSGAGQVDVWETKLGSGGTADMVKAAVIDPVELGFDRAHLPHDPWVVGNLLYVSWYKEGLQVFNIANPVKPVLIGSYRTSDNWSKAWCETGNWGVYPMLGKHRILASDVEYGLMVLSVTEKQLVAAGQYHTAALRGDGLVYSWGRNNVGQIGNGTTSTQALTPTVSSQGASPGITSVAAGMDFTLALRRDGLIYGWGVNANGNLGRGNTTPSTSPVAALGSTYTAVAAGGLHALALRKDGTLWAWGYGGEGQTGQNGTGNTLSPSQVTLSSPNRAIKNDWVAIAAGSNHSLAIRADGTLWAWGYNAYGQLGIGNKTNQLYPVQVGTATDWADVKAGQKHTVALKKNGTLWCWGDGTWGQLGRGNTTSWTTPAAGPAGNFYAAVGAGMGHSWAVKTDGSLVTWGVNTQGQIGNNTTTNALNAVAVGPASPAWLQVASFAQNTIGVRADGTLWSWGENAYGTLGLGHTTTPIKVPTLSTLYSSTYLAFGTSTTVPDNTEINLTNEGTMDWGKWGERGVYTYDHKDKTQSLISSTSYGTAQIWNQNEISYRWNDGFLDPAKLSTTVQYTAGTGTGMDISLPAATVPRTVVLYLGLGQCQAKVTATVSSQSGAVTRSATFTQNNGLSGHKRLPIYIQAAAGQQTLRISWRVITDYGGGNVALEAVTVKTGP